MDSVCDFATPAISTLVSNCPEASQTRKRGEGADSVTLKAAQQRKPCLGLAPCLEAKPPAKAMGEEEVVQPSEQKGLLIYPTFHIQKLRVVKTPKKIYSSNNC